MRLLFNTSVGINLPVSSDAFEGSVQEEFIGCLDGWEFGLRLL